MDKLEEMWAALTAYQPQADAAGHGPSWARMCEEKTADAAADAADAANAAADAAADAANAANAAYYAAADAAADAADAKKWAQIAIGRITRVLVKPAPEQYTALEQALTRLQKRYGELEAKVAAQPAQLAPVQVLQRYSPDGEGGMEVDSLGVYVKHQDVSNPPAQPAVPDAITDSGEDPKYRAGWNECRETMLEMMKARTL
jgi:hypothetical protein